MRERRNHIRTLKEVKRHFTFSGFLLIFFFLLPVCLRSQTAEDYLQTALTAFSEEKHEFALESIKKAIDLRPGELEYKYLLALILIKQDKPKEGEEILNALLLFDEVRFSKAFFDLAEAYRRQRKHKNVILALEKAEKVDRARSLIEQGFLYLDTGELDKAIQKLEEAKEFPDYNQSACYNLGIAFHRKKDYKRARSFAQEAIEIAPETEIARHAKSLIEAIRGEMRLRKRFWLVSSIAGQYDDNVILQPLEQAGLQRIGIPPSKQNDYVTIVTVKGQYKPFVRKNWEFTLENTYLHYLYSKLTRNDLIALMPAARFNISYHPLFLRLSYAYGRFFVHNESYAQVHSLSPSISIAEGRYGRSELMFQADLRRYLDGITPDADHYALSLWQFFLIPKYGELRIGYKYEIEDNKQDKGDFISHEFIGGIAIPFIFKSHLNLYYSYLIREFEFTEVISPTQEREDKEHFIYAFLNKRFGRYFELNFMYIYTLNDSNIEYPILDFGGLDPYHWRKNVVSISFSVLF